MLAVESRLRKQPTQARSRMTVDAFLEAADRVLRREGYETASTNRLARVAGFSVGSLYQYFDDKQAVVGTLIDRELRQEARELVAVVDAAQGDWRMLLQAAIDCTVQLRVAHAHLYRTLEGHPEDFGGRQAPCYARRLQAPLAGDAVQRAVASHLVRLGAGRVEPQLTAGCRLVNAATCMFAVEAPAHVPAEQMTSTLVRVLGLYAEAGETPSAESLACIARWRDDAKAQRAPEDVRARRLQEVRSRLLQNRGIATDELEAAVHVGASLDLVVREFATQGTASHSADDLAVECACLLDAVAAEVLLER